MKSHTLARLASPFQEGACFGKDVKGDLEESVPREDQTLNALEQCGTRRQSPKFDMNVVFEKIFDTYFSLSAIDR